MDIWNEAIASALNSNRIAYKEWKEAGRPDDIENPLLKRKKETRKVYRQEIRNEELRRKHEERNTISNANQTDKNLFFKLIRKQRKKGNIFITDLHVENEVFSRENIIDGFHLHFSKLAIPTADETYNYDHLNLCEQDYDTIEQICSHYATMQVDVSTVKEAIASINRGKAEDIFWYLNRTYNIC